MRLRIEIPRKKKILLKNIIRIFFFHLDLTWQFLNVKLIFYYYFYFNSHVSILCANNTIS